jgi:hypothetical protein
MPKKSHKFRWKNLFLLLVAAILLAALYFFTYYFFLQMFIGENPAPAEVPVDVQQPEDTAIYSHLPKNETSTAVTPASSVATPVTPPPSAPVVTTPPPKPKPTPPPAATSTADLPSAALDLASLTVSTSSDASLSFGSFQENFVGPANIDSNLTTLYRDNRAIAMFFPPDYSWEAATGELVNLFQNNFASLRFNDFDGPYEDERCFGANCLEQQGADLFYNGQPLARPAALKDSSIAAVSLGALTKNWLVGFTLKDGNDYRGRVFYFDGAKFTPLALPAEISSPSFGLFGFGGEESDFLVIYGAPNAVAYRVRDAFASDISRWFSPRVMGKGFQPEIIRIGRRSGAEQGSDIVWYVYSSTLYRPQLIKLWQNSTADIVGEAVFTNLLFGDSSASAGFKLVSSQSDRIILLADWRESGTDSWRVFTDRGFKNTQAASLITKPIPHDGAASPIIINSIAAARLGLDFGSVQFAQFLFSEDGAAWRQIPAGANAYFITDKIRNYRLQVAFPAFPDRFYSPFLDSVLFDYYARKFNK